MVLAKVRFKTLLNAYVFTMAEVFKVFRGNALYNLLLRGLLPYSIHADITFSFLYTFIYNYL